MEMHKDLQKPELYEGLGFVVCFRVHFWSFYDLYFEFSYHLGTYLLYIVRPVIQSSFHIMLISTRSFSVFICF